jgi:hypothetical protein
MTKEELLRDVSITVSQINNLQDDLVKTIGDYIKATADLEEDIEAYQNTLEAISALEDTDPISLAKEIAQNALKGIKRKIKND